MAFEYGGIGPSSKVMTTSRSLSGNVLAYCMLPIRLNSFGLMERTRLVPSASGLPANGSAAAATRPSNQTNNTTTTRIRPPDRTPSRPVKDNPTLWRATLTEDYALWTQHRLVFQ